MRRKWTLQIQKWLACSIYGMMPIMPEFSDMLDYYMFEDSVKRKSRYIYDDDVNAFLRTVMETS
jgi:hypothetical protein